MENTNNTTNTNTTTPESTGNVNTENSAANWTDEQWFAKLDEIFEKRNQRTAKSVLKDNGKDDDEIAEFLTKYNASKTAAKNKTTEEISKLQEENASLKKQIFDGELSSAAATVAADLGINPAKLKHVLKLADLTTATKDGKVDNDALKAAIEAVIADVPEFKNSQSQGGVRKVGAGEAGGEPSDAIDKFRKALGLKD